MPVNGGDDSAEESQNCPSLVLGGETVETEKETKKQNTLFFRQRLFLVNKQTFQGKGERGKVIFVFVVVLFALF